MKLRVLAGLLIILSSCENNEVVDPLKGQLNVFSFEDKVYNTTGGSYFLYDKIDSKFYYCFLIGTNGTYVFPENVNESYVDGDFVRIFLQADSLDNILGDYEIVPNENNIVSTAGQPKTIASGEIKLKEGVNEIKIIEVEGRTTLGEKLNLRAELTDLSVAYKITRTVRGDFEFNTNTYDISQAFSFYNENDSQLTLGVQDDNEAIASQIVFYINRSENLVPGVYSGAQDGAENSFTGHVSINAIEGNSQILQTNFFEGTLVVGQDGDLYDITFNIKTFSGHTISGHYLGELIK